MALQYMFLFFVVGGARVDDSVADLLFVNEE